MATALQIAIEQGLDINELASGTLRVAALAAEAEREAMIMKARVGCCRPAPAIADPSPTPGSRRVLSPL